MTDKPTNPFNHAPDELPDALDEMFAQARGDAPEFSDALAARMLTDARQIQATCPSGQIMSSSAPKSRGFWGQLLVALGGWGGVGGLATACAAGVWIGVAPPSGLPDPIALVSVDSSAAEESFDIFDVDAVGDIFLTEDS